jgi:hypothetical protein
VIADVILATDIESIGLLRAVADNAKEAWEGNGTTPALAQHASDQLHGALVDVLETFRPSVR